MTYDATALDAELRVAGLRIHGCASTGRIDWIDAPTPTEQATAAQVLAQHDADKRQREQRAEDDARRTVVDRVLIDAATAASWAALSPAQRNEEVRLMLLASALDMKRRTRP